MLQELTMSIRQRGDPELGDLLKRVRTAACTESDLKILQVIIVLSDNKISRIINRPFG